MNSTLVFSSVVNSSSPSSVNRKSCIVLTSKIKSTLVLSAAFFSEDALIFTMPVVPLETPSRTSNSIVTKTLSPEGTAIFPSTATPLIRTRRSTEDSMPVIEMTALSPPGKLPVFSTQKLTCVVPPGGRTISI